MVGWGEDLGSAGCLVGLQWPRCGGTSCSVRGLGVWGWVPGPSPGRDPQGLLHVLVDHIGDAHSRDDLHGVGGNAPVEAPHALLG